MEKGSGQQELEQQNILRKLKAREQFLKEQRDKLETLWERQQESHSRVNAFYDEVLSGGGNDGFYRRLERNYAEISACDNKARHQLENALDDVWEEFNKVQIQLDEAEKV